MAAEEFQITVDGRPVAVAPGTTVAAALWSAGIAACRISVSGEERGPLCAMGICFECRVTIDGKPHQRSCMLACAPGMVVATGEAAVAMPPQILPLSEMKPGLQSTGPPRHGETTFGRMATTIVGESAVGEGVDGAAARATGDGVGTTVDGEPWPATLRADVVVVGAGPAGLAAACRAAEAGAGVVVLDQAPAPGGQIWRGSVIVPAGERSHRGADRRGLAGGGAVARPAATRVARRWLQRFATSGAHLLAGATVIDALQGDASLAEPSAAPAATLLVEQGGRGLRVVAGRLIVATGARERFLPFPGWTLPNVMGVGGAQALLKSGARVEGRRVVVAGSGPLLLPVAAALAKAGARIVLVAEQAPAAAVTRFAAGLWRHPRLLVQALRFRAAFWRAPYRRGAWVSAASGAAATRAVGEATLTDGVRTWREPCDLLACAYGLVPNLRLARLLGCALSGGSGRRAVKVDGFQQTSVAGIYCAGEPAGIGGLDLALLTGQIAGLAAAEAAVAAPTPGAGQTGDAGDALQAAAGSGDNGDLGGTSETDGARDSGTAAVVAGATIAVSMAPPRHSSAARPARDLASLQRRRGRAQRYAEALERAFQPRPDLLLLADAGTIVCRCEDVPLGRIDPAWGPRQAKLYTRAGMGPCQGRVCGAALEVLRGWDEPDTIRAPLEPVELGTLVQLEAETAPVSRSGRDPNTSD